MDIRRNDRVRNEALYEASNLTPLSEIVKLHQLRFLGHSLRRPCNDFINEYALYHPTHGNPGRGRRKQLYHQYIAKLLNPDFITTSNEIRATAQNRNVWRRLIVAACRWQPP